LINFLFTGSEFLERTNTTFGKQLTHTTSGKQLIQQEEKLFNLYDENERTRGLGCIIDNITFIYNHLIHFFSQPPNLKLFHCLILLLLYSLFNFNFNFQRI